MKEIEVKILDINEEEIKEKLSSLGAKKYFDGEVNAVHFDSPHRELRKTGECLRVRTVGDEVEFCYKGKDESKVFKSKEEIEVKTNNFENTIKILENLGFERFHEAKKHRQSFKLGNVKFELDKYSEIPVFLEIEAPSEEEVVEYVKKLGFTMEQTTNLGAREIIKQYLERKIEDKIQ